MQTNNGNNRSRVPGNKPTLAERLQGAAQQLGKAATGSLPTTKALVSAATYAPAKVPTELLLKKRPIKDAEWEKIREDIYNLQSTLAFKNSAISGWNNYNDKQTIEVRHNGTPYMSLTRDLDNSLTLSYIPPWIEMPC